VLGLLFGNVRSISDKIIRADLSSVRFVFQFTLLCDTNLASRADNIRRAPFPEPLGTLLSLSYLLTRMSEESVVSQSFLND
jgi:hypothetical protein